jgi:hypothetical protein
MQYRNTPCNQQYANPIHYSDKMLVVEGTMFSILFAKIQQQTSLDVL